MDRPNREFGLLFLRGSIRSVRSKMFWQKTVLYVLNSRSSYNLFLNRRCNAVLTCIGNFGNALRLYGRLWSGLH